MSGYQTALQLGALIGFWGAYASHSTFPSSSSLQWKLPVGVQLVPGLLLLFGTMLIPETPRFLAGKRRYLKAEAALSWLRGASQGSSEIGEEMEGLSLAAELTTLTSSNKRSFLQEICTKSIRRRLGVGVGLMIAQNMVGLNALNYYAPVIFMSAGFTSVSSSLFLTGVFGVVKLGSSAFFMFWAVRYKGNRFWLRWGAVVCGLSMLVLAYFVRELPAPERGVATGLTLGGVISVLMVYLFAFSFGVSLGPISWNVCSEVSILP